MVLLHSKALRIAFRPGPVYLDTAKEKCIEWTDTNGGRQGGYRVSDLEKVHFFVLQEALDNCCGLCCRWNRQGSKDGLDCENNKNILVSLIPPATLKPHLL